MVTASGDLGRSSPHPPTVTLSENHSLYQVEAFQNLYRTIYADKFFEHLSLGEARKTRSDPYSGSDEGGCGEALRAEEGRE